MGKKTKKKVKIVPLMILIIMIVGSIGTYIGYEYYQKINSLEYKLAEIGYNETQIEEIKKLDNDKINFILNREYDEYTYKFISEKYYIKENLNDYLTYKKEHDEYEISDIIARVNVGLIKDFYEDSKKTDISKGILMLVNKYNYLDENYDPEDLKAVPLTYAFSGKKLKEEAYEAFINMASAAKKEGLTLLANSAYRDYEYQNKLYKDYMNNHGQAWADSYAARPGYSEHQTGLVVDVSTLKNTMDDFEETDEFKWISQHCYEYGFILRYPKNKEYLTGYNYESWHYRYVGVKVAKEIQELGITFDEYYAFYLK